MSCSQGRQQAEVHMEQIEPTVQVVEGEAVVVATMVAVSDIGHTDSIHVCKFEPVCQYLVFYFFFLNQPCGLQAWACYLLYLL